MIFFKACTTGPKGALNPMKSLNRFQFVEAVVRLALLRWKNDVDSPIEAILTMLDRMAHIIEEAVDQHMFHDRLWVEMTDDAHKRHAEGLRRC